MIRSPSYSLHLCTLDLVLQIAEEALAEVAGYGVELVRLFGQLLAELLRVVRLQRVLLLPPLLVLKALSVYVALLDDIAFSTELVEGVPAHEVNSGQLELLVAGAAVLLLSEVFARPLHPQYVLLHLLNTLCHLLHAGVLNFAPLIQIALKV